MSLPSDSFTDISAHRLSHNSDLCGSLTPSCCKYMAPCSTDLTLPSSEGTKSLEILPSLRYIRYWSTLRPGVRIYRFQRVRLLSTPHTSNSYWPLVISYCDYMACYPASIPTQCRPTMRLRSIPPPPRLRNRAATRPVDFIVSIKIARRPLNGFKNASGTLSMFTRRGADVHSALACGPVPTK